MPRKGLLIVIEGGDFSGKLVQSNALHNHLSSLSEDNDVITTHEPTNNAKKLKEKLARDTNPYQDTTKMAEIYIEDRTKHTRRIISPMLEEGVIVIANRYSMSTCVYQSVQGIPMDELIETHSEREILTPDLTFLLDISPEEAGKRIMKKHNTETSVGLDKFERNKNFRNQVYNRYLDLACSIPTNPKYQRFFGPVVVINGNNPEKQVTADIFAKFQPVYDSWII